MKHSTALTTTTQSECLSVLGRLRQPRNGPNGALTCTKTLGRIRVALCSWHNTWCVSYGLTTTNEAAVPETTGRRSHPGGVMGRSSGAATCTTTRSVPASTS